MDLLVRFVDLCGYLIDIATLSAWVGYFYVRHKALPWYQAQHEAFKQETDPPPPDKWSRIADIVFYVAVALTFLWIMRLGRLQQLPVRG